MAERPASKKEARRVWLKDSDALQLIYKMMKTHMDSKAKKMTEYLERLLKGKSDKLKLCTSLR
jgi:hypothetical protein